MKACENITAEIFVVDNNSTDGSRDWLEKKFPGIIFKWNDENVGFAKANNSVLKEARGDKVLFLNPDTIVPEDCFEKCNNPPWVIVPADQNWYKEYVMLTAILETLRSLDMKFPGLKKS